MASSPRRVDDAKKAADAKGKGKKEGKKKEQACPGWDHTSAHALSREFIENLADQVSIV